MNGAYANGGMYLRIYKASANVLDQVGLIRRAWASY